MSARDCERVGLMGCVHERRFWIAGGQTRPAGMQLGCSREVATFASRMEGFWSGRERCVQEHGYVERTGELTFWRVVVRMMTRVRRQLEFPVSGAGGGRDRAAAPARRYSGGCDLGAQAKCGCTLGSGRFARLRDLRLEPSGDVAYVRQVARFRYEDGRFWSTKSASIGSARRNWNLPPQQRRPDAPHGCAIKKVDLQGASRNV